MINGGVRVGEMAPSKSTSFPDMLEMAPIFFMPCMTNSRHHAKLFWFSTSFAFSVVFSVKKCLIMGGRVATCIRCQKSYKPGMDDCHGHAHLLEKVGVILRISKSRACLMKGCSGWLEGST